MYTLTDTQIEFIQNDIRARGVLMVGLQQDLLDHICCVIEQELDPDGNFDDFYQHRIRTFYKTDLSEIEQETIQLLTFKNYYVMKKIMLFAGAFSVLTMTAGLFFKFFHMPGASFLIAVGIILLSLVFLPLLFTLKIRENSSSRDKIITGVGTFAGILISVGTMFKIFHWPGANIIGILALSIMLLVFLPVYFFSGIRNPETKVNTIVSSIFIFYGCALILMMVRSSAASNQLMRENAEMVLRNENMLSEQQKLTAALVSQSRIDNPSAQSTKLENEQAGQIGLLANQLKQFLIASETGKAQLGSGDMLSDMDAGHYISDSPKAEAQLKNLTGKIQSFNKTSGGNIPEISGIENRKLSQSINDLILVEMAVLQNESAVALQK
ncbi:hypothetical protein [Flavobacterium silvaticum]|uniref:Uncharacterized protein n=1 Tax=Flavobacterium silvaticum TaxID=1852020 RepID=A0A972JFL1_9FLAO|nr:hypothetical protein [Flavobacterium silvaticum]NMH27296.1 hypothetical protein [Flavobacterium silvaticum]